MRPIDRDTLRRLLSRLVEAKDDPNEWETGQVALELTDGQSVDGVLVAFDGTVAVVDAGTSVAEFSLGDIADVEFEMRSPGPE
jgi:small nuclear ribonucleoprotein (snRNP)-like protein